MTGFLLGKFLPPHAGHLHLIRSARARVDRLVVLVGTTSQEPIPGELRAEWLRELCSDCEIVHSPGDVPQEPAEHPDFWRIWHDKIRSAVPEPIDVVFSSEEYGWELARVLGTRHEMIDQPRAAVPISATKIRDNPARYWDYIPAPVRPWFVRRVLLYGPESTGKSTLAQLLAAHFHTTWVPEFARGYLDGREPFVVREEDLPVFLHEQPRSEAAAARTSGPVLFCDTDNIVTSVYGRYYFGFPTDWAQEFIARQKPYDLILFCDIDIPWVDDGQRDRPHRREEMRELFREGLESRGLAYTMIRGNFEERLARAIAAVNEMMSRPASHAGWKHVAFPPGHPVAPGKLRVC